jgi:hypothetical protein
VLPKGENQLLVNRQVVFQSGVESEYIVLGVTKTRRGVLYLALALWRPPQGRPLVQVFLPSSAVKLHVVYRTIKTVGYHARVSNMHHPSLIYENCSSDSPVNANAYKAAAPIPRPIASSSPSLRLRTAL